jgi:uncharacterized protein YyaL (SSP411 family)
MAERTLKAMRAGGIWDHLGFGFHRYSTDDQWHLPHFEKMLYDQALHALAYTEAFQASGNPLYRSVAGDIMTCVLRDLADPGGGFCSAEDADSEGEEGTFYVWNAEEIRRILGKEAARAFGEAYQVREEGNYIEEAPGQRTGRNILHWKGDPPAELPPDLEKARRTLFAAREKRPRPHRDDKVLTDWNGLMLAALARAAASVTPAAPRPTVAAFLHLETMLRNGMLLHRWRTGKRPSSQLGRLLFPDPGAHRGYQAFLDPSLLAAAIFRLQASRPRFRTSVWGETISHPREPRPPGPEKAIYDGANPSATPSRPEQAHRPAHRRISGQRDRASADPAQHRLRGANDALVYTMLMARWTFSPIHPMKRHCRRPRLTVHGCPAGGRPERYLPGGTSCTGGGARRRGNREIAHFEKDMKPVGGKGGCLRCRHFSQPGTGHGSPEAPGSP